MLCPAVEQPNTCLHPPQHPAKKKIAPLLSSNKPFFCNKSCHVGRRRGRICAQTPRPLGRVLQQTLQVRCSEISQAQNVRVWVSNPRYANMQSASPHHLPTRRPSPRGVHGRTYTLSRRVDAENHLHRMSGRRMTASYSLFSRYPGYWQRGRGWGMRHVKCELPRHLPLLSQILLARSRSPLGESVCCVSLLPQPPLKSSSSSSSSRHR